MRDRIPEIIKAAGGVADVRRLDGGAFRRALCEKLYEEAGELNEAANAADVLDEAADVVEVVRAMAAAYGSGARSGDQFCVYVCDRYVLAALTEEDRAAIKNGDLRLLNALTRKHIRDRYTYRFVPTPDGPTARKLELEVQKGSLGTKPLLNPR